MIFTTKKISFILYVITYVTYIGNSGLGSTIFNGVDVRPGQLPWQVEFGNNACGGTLVSLQVRKYVICIDQNLVIKASLKYMITIWIFSGKVEFLGNFDF